MMVGRLVAAVFCLTVAVPLAAQERETANTVRAAKDAAGPPATLEAMKWLVGHWKGTGLGAAYPRRCGPSLLAA